MKLTKLDIKPSATESWNTSLELMGIETRAIKFSHSVPDISWNTSLELMGIETADRRINKPSVKGWNTSLELMGIETMTALPLAVTGQPLEHQPRVNGD